MIGDGNAAESIPLCALLMRRYECDGGEKMLLHAAVAVLIVALVPDKRVGHHMGYYRSSGNAKYPEV